MRSTAWLWCACALGAIPSVHALAGGQPPPDFVVGIELPAQAPASPAVERALRAMGVGYVIYYLSTVRGAPDHRAEQVNREMMALCDRLGIPFSISTYEIDPPDACVRDAARNPRFRGMVFDELEHIRLLNFDRPVPLADYRGFRTLPQAWDETVAGFTRLRKRYQGLGASSTATHVFPVLLHAAARAGMAVCPKICKETYSPVSFAIGMGAALEYGVPLWADCDLWFYDLVPGHTPAEMRDNLLMAYWLGADLVYIEGAGHNLTPAGAQGVPFSLMSQVTPEMYQLTPHGEALRAFARDYMPAHPRPWSFRDVRPRIAIVRMDDTDWGQRFAGGFTRGLFGSDALQPTADSDAWFQIWNVLTCGRTGRDGITYFKSYIGQTGYQRAPEPDVAASYATRPLQSGYHRFFAPLNGAVVYDHLVGYDRLRGIPLLFLTGPVVSAETMAAIRRCVREGATCVAWGPLAARSGFADWKSGVRVTPDGKGRWVITDDFGASDAVGAIWGQIGRPDEIRYRFGDHEVVIRDAGGEDVAVEVDGGRV